MKKIFPSKLKQSDSVRVVAPARSLAMPWINNQEMKDIASERFAGLGLKLTFGDHVYDRDDFESSSIENRISDLHQAFRDPAVKMIITVIGGFNSNQLLPYLDYDLIRQNPKIVCGYSDITALANAIYAMTGLVTYSGPHYSSFGDKLGFDYTLEYFKKALFSQDPFRVDPSSKWSNDRWIGKQSERTFLPNEGYWVINPGSCTGTIIGGNQCTLNLLHGTQYMPSFEESVLFLEDDYEAHAATFDRDLQSLIHQPGFSSVKGIVIGRFQPESGVTRALLEQIIHSKEELRRIPVIANADFGHTTPQITFPIGGTVSLKVSTTEINLEIIEH